MALAIRSNRERRCAAAGRRRRSRSATARIRRSASRQRKKQCRNPPKNSARSRGWTGYEHLCKARHLMPPRFVIEIRPHRYGWTCQEPFGPERVFILKPQAIEFALRQCAAFSAEI